MHPDVEQARVLATVTFGAPLWALEVDAAGERALVTDGEGRTHFLSIERAGTAVTARARRGATTPPSRVRVSELPE